MTDRQPEGGRLASLREEAEREMRRRLPSGGGRAAKRQKACDGGLSEGQQPTGAPVGDAGRFDYGAVGELATGITGFLLTCPIQRCVCPGAGSGGVCAVARLL